MIEIKKNQVMPRAPSLTKLKRTNGAGQPSASWNNNIDDEDNLSNDEEGNTTNKFQFSQRQIIQSPTRKKIEFEDEQDKLNENNRDDEKIIFGDSKSVGGSMLIYDKINQKSRNIKLERANSKIGFSGSDQVAKQDSKSVENNAATSSLHLEQTKTLFFKQNSIIMSENNIVSPKDENPGAISMSITSLQNQNQLLSPIGTKSSANILNLPQQKSHFASILKAHRVSISKSGTTNNLSNKDNNFLYRNSTTKDGLVKFMSTIQSQTSILKKKKTMNEKALYGGWNIMGKIFIILRFMKSLKRASIFYNFHSLKQMHYSIIGDKAHIDKDEKDRIKKNNFSNYLKCILPNIAKVSKVIKVFQPDNIWILIFYNVIILGLTIFTAFYEMILSSFNGFDDIEIITPRYETFRKVAGITFFFEILIRFNTGTYREGIIIFTRDVVFKNYIRFKFFWVDIITAIALVSNIDNYIFALFIFLLRCIKIWRLAQDLNDHFRIWYRFPTGWILTKLFFMIIILAHFWGCQFHYIGRLETEAGLNSWMIRYSLIHESWYIKYIHSFYFTTISMITIGYGDIVPVTTIEKCYCTLVAVLGSCFFSYIVNTIGSIFQEISNKEAAIKQQKNNISDYMAKRNINQKLQLKVIKYLDYTHSRSGDGPLKGQIILNSIAKNLREEVQIEYFGNILQNTRIFKQNFSQECLRALSLKLKEIMYGPGEVIFHKGELDYKIFFIQSGEVSLFLEKDGGEIFEMAKLSKSQHFGQFGFFGCKPREIAVKCCDITHLVYLENEDFISVIKNFQEDYEKYYMMKDEINFKDKKLSTKCSSCGAFDHTIVDCSLVTPHFNRFRIMIKHIYPVIQKRQALIRERSKFHTYQKNYIVREDLKKLRNNLAQKFIQSGEIDEVSDENDYSDENDTMYQQQTKHNNPMDDKEYFMKQKMQFRYLDGEIVNYESDNTHNYITDENQSQLMDQMNQTNQTQNAFGSQQTLQLKESNISQNDSVPEIVVQRKDMKQLSIIKNNYNPYLRSNSVVQKQSLFRMESLAALSSDIQKEDAPSKGIGTAPQSCYPISGGFASATGQTPRQDLDNQNQSDNYKSQQNFYTQGIYDNTSNVNSVNQNGTPRQFGTGAAIGIDYLTQQNIQAASQTVNSTPLKSIDQSIDENKNQSTAPQQNQQSNQKKKSSLTTEQLQLVKEKLQMLNENKKKKKKQIPQIRKKKVSIQIEGKVDQEDSSSNNYLEEEEDESDDSDKSWISDQHNNGSPPFKYQRKNSSDSDNKKKDSNALVFQSPKSAISQPYPAPFEEPLQINIKPKNFEENIQQDPTLTAKEKINKKLMSYQGEKIIERKSEQSMQDLEVSSMTLVNHQLLTQQKSNNTNNLSQFRQNTHSVTIIQEEKRENLKIDIDSLHQYDSASSPSNPQQKYKNSNFFGFNKQNGNSQNNSQDLDQPLGSPHPKLNLGSPQFSDEKHHEEDDGYHLDESDEAIETDLQQLDGENHISPVKTPTHRRITIQAEKVFAEQQQTDSIESPLEDLNLKQNDYSDYNSTEKGGVTIENLNYDQQYQEVISMQQQQGSNKNKNNFLNLDAGQLDPVQEILSKNSQDGENTSPDQRNNGSRRLSSKSDNRSSFRQCQPPQFTKSISQNANPPQLTHCISSIPNNNNASNENFMNTPNLTNTLVPQPRSSLNYFNEMNNNTVLQNIQNNNNIVQNKPETDQQIPSKKSTVIISSSNQVTQNDQSQYSYSSSNNNQYNPLVNNYWTKEGGGGSINQMRRQQSLSYMQGGNFNQTNDMRKMIAYNRANSKPFIGNQDELIQGAAIYGIHNYGQAPMNNQPKQYHPVQVSRKIKNSNQSQNYGNVNSPSHNITSSKRNIAYPPIADSFSQQVMYHQKYEKNKNYHRSRNSIQVQLNQSQQNNQPFYNDASNANPNTPRKRQQTIVPRFNQKGQFSNTYSQMNNASSSNHTSFANNTRGRMTSWVGNNVNNLPSLAKPDSQTNLPNTEDQYEEELIEYESVSNADMYIYDFDIMKEYKKYYPQHNYKSVISDCLRQRKPFKSNKSLHNNPFIQKLVAKKKQIPRRLPSLIRLYDKDKKDE